MRIKFPGIARTQRLATQSTIYRKFVLSSICLVFVPLIALLFWLNEQTSYSLIEYHMERSRNETEFAIDILDTQIEGIINIRTALSANTQLNEHYSTDDLASVYSLRSTLKSLASVQTSIAEMHLYTQGDPYIFSSQSSYSIKTFGRKYNLSDSDLQAVLDETIYPGCIMHTQNKYTHADSLLFFLTFPSEAGRRTLVVDVPVLNIAPLLMQLVNVDGGVVIVRNAAGEPLLTYQVLDRFASFPMDEAQNTLENFPLSYVQQILKVGDAEYLTSSYLLNAFPLRVQQIIPSRFVVSDTLDQHARWIALIACAAFVILLVMLLNGRMIYRPVGQLIDYVMDAGWHERGHGSMSDTEYLKSYLEHVHEQNTQLSDHIHTIRAEYRRETLLRLFEGGVETKDELVRLDPERLTPLLQGQFAFFAFFLQPATPSLADVQIVTAQKAFEHDNATPVYVCGFRSPECLIGIAFYPAGTETLCDSYLDECTRRVRSALGERTLLGVGGEYTDIHYAPQSLLEAVCACDQTLRQPDAKTRMFAIHENDTDFEDMLAQLSDTAALDAYWEDGIDAVMERTRAFIAAHADNLGYARYLCYKAVYGLWVMTKLHLTDSGKSVLPVRALTLAKDSDALCVILDEASNDYRRRLSESHSRNQSILYSDMLHHLDRHLSDAEFSLQAMSDVFSMSLPILSKYFKDRSGSTIADYLARMRMQAACQMLEQTNMTVKEIGVAVGYNNATSFIRRFRSDMGVSPGQYRADADNYHTP